MDPHRLKLGRGDEPHTYTHPCSVVDRFLFLWAPRSRQCTPGRRGNLSKPVILPSTKYGFASSIRPHNWSLLGLVTAMRRVDMESIHLYRGRTEAVTCRQTKPLGSRAWWGLEVLDNSCNLLLHFTRSYLLTHSISNRLESIIRLGA